MKEDFGALPGYAGTGKRAVGTAGGRALAPFVGATVVYLGVRSAVLGGLGGYVGREVHRQLLTVIATRYLRSLLYPVDHLEFVLPVDRGRYRGCSPPFWPSVSSSPG